MGWRRIDLEDYDMDQSKDPHAWGVPLPHGDDRYVIVAPAGVRRVHVDHMVNCMGPRWTSVFEWTDDPADDFDTLIARIEIELQDRRLDSLVLSDVLGTVHRAGYGLDAWGEELLFALTRCPGDAWRVGALLRETLTALGAEHE